MASWIPEHVDEDVEDGAQDFLKCPACKQEYTEPPLRFPCHHACCRQCVQQRHSPPDTLECPCCRSKHPIDNLAELEINSPVKMIQQGRDKLKQDLQKEFECDECEQSKGPHPAVGMCVRCVLYLCQDQVDNHRSSRRYSRHEIQPVKSGMMPMKEEPVCTKHPEERLKVYCPILSESICRECDIEGHQGCRSDHLKLDTAAKDKSWEMSADIETLKTSTVQGLKEAIQRNRALDTESQEKRENTIAKITDDFQALRTYIDDREAEVKAAVRKAQQDEHQRIQHSLEHLIADLHNSQQLRTATRYLLDATNNTSIMSESKGLQAQVKDAISREETKEKSRKLPHLIPYLYQAAEVIEQPSHKSPLSQFVLVRGQDATSVLCESQNPHDLQLVSMPTLRRPRK
ncbi:E3 ubiquitin-protein ligase TRIM71-like [Sycon ciliatum]|uniref:E3 ubiquitin-protein ligase TRIM71-like n=1 Tax=Sycon ciliatum TaxID=27933 RepID=UPI0031F66115